MGETETRGGLQFRLDDFRSSEGLSSESPVARGHVDVPREHRTNEDAGHQVFEAALLETKSKPALAFGGREQLFVAAHEPAAKDRFGTHDPEVRLIRGKFLTGH